jgi:hypothetical protein
VKQVTNLSSVGIIYRLRDPADIFLEIKGVGYPMPAFRNCLCFIGGNWIGSNAANDHGPRDTFCREVCEELSLDHGTQGTIELGSLGLTTGVESFEARSFDHTPTQPELDTLEDLKATITGRALSFGDYLNTIPREVLDRADPTNTRDGFVSLASYWTVGLREQEWRMLAELQATFHNLSCEALSPGSATLITSLQELTGSRARCAFGHDQVLQRFFLNFGLGDARRLTIYPGITSEPLGPTLASYREYLDRYDVQRRPV